MLKVFMVRGPEGYLDNFSSLFNWIVYEMGIVPKISGRDIKETHLNIWKDDDIGDDDMIMVVNSSCRVAVGSDDFHEIVSASEMLLEDKKCEVVLLGAEKRYRTMEIDDHFSLAKCLSVSAYMARGAVIRSLPRRSFGSDADFGLDLAFRTKTACLTQGNLFSLPVREGREVYAQNIIQNFISYC